MPCSKHPVVRKHIKWNSRFVEAICTNVKGFEPDGRPDFRSTATDQLSRKIKEARKDVQEHVYLAKLRKRSEDSG